ncbi:MAG: hypothetical protein LUQ61_03750 [Methanoregulaceae archaeon]|nr:hypothetical protein [Methanoregulaceae archaeon]
MSDITATGQVRQIMQDFARETGLDPVATRPRRYLWTDSFAVCNYLELFRRTGDEAHRDLALRLVGQVHNVLGRHREDDPRSGWISGLDDQEGAFHPTIGGLRIGKPRPERKQGEPPNERMEWEQDGQYYHYLTRWMHALNRTGCVTGEPVYTSWAVELARTAHARFVYTPPSSGQKRMYWKMSIALSRPQVASMGLHDPLDGLVSYCGLQMSLFDLRGQLRGPDLLAEINDMAGICRDRNFATDDPLGIGGLLADAHRIAGLMVEGGFTCHVLLESVVSSALRGIEAYLQTAPFRTLPEQRLAFRELGLSIGLSGVLPLWELIERNPGLFEPEGGIARKVAALERYTPLADTITGFWLDGKNGDKESWNEHRDINAVMLATSLAPGSFLEP